jgi:hypothetical protein
MMNRSQLPRKLVSGLAILIGAIPLQGCLTAGSGTSNRVTIESIRIVCLSRKDTDGTKRQVVENNAALESLGAKTPDCKKFMVTK